MKKYGLYCPIRKPSPYKKMAKDMKTNHVAQNIVNRKFNEQKVRHVFLTDITYIPYNGQFCYLSPIMDLCTNEIVAYTLSESLEVQFVLDMVDSLVKKHGATLDDSIIIHSDQGCHYTSNAFIRKLKDADFVQSISRKGNCWDNAPQESFFGHMKDEIGTAIGRCKTFKEIKEIIDDWIDYYNNERYQWDLDKLSPAEYYQYKLTGNYPIELQSGVSKGLRNI
jgi:transposase InsO family protein